MEVIDAILHSIDPENNRIKLASTASIERMPDTFVNADLIVRFAPNNDEAFVRFAYEAVLCREPTSGEVLTSTFDIKRHAIARADFIGQIVDVARAEGKRAEISGLADTGKPHDRSPAPYFVNSEVLDGNGRQKLILVQHRNELGWIVSPDIWRQKVDIEQDFWAVNEGWILTGPKKTLPSGQWQLEIDLVQPDTATVTLDVVANSGLDCLAKASFGGSASCTLNFKVEPFHHFLEVRLFKPGQSPQNRRLKIRSLVLIAMQEERDAAH